VILGSFYKYIELLAKKHHRVVIGGFIGGGRLKLVGAPAEAALMAPKVTLEVA
jgi:hypothetical protein